MQSMTGKILVIDDEEDICRILKDWLGSTGNSVTYHTSSRAAITAFAQERASIVLLDICMPDMDGLEVLSQLKSIDKNVIVILMTGFPSDETVTKALSLGAYDYITKPFQIEKINFLIERAFSYYKLISAQNNNP